jgi:hypothetical protein
MLDYFFQPACRKLQKFHHECCVILRYSTKAENYTKITEI